MRLSSRLDWSAGPNRLSAALARRRREGRPIHDLTVSNPTRAGLDLPTEELAECLGRGARERYQPSALGLLSAREALATHLGSEVHPDDLVLTASTSEALSLLFRVLADPGDEVLAPAPSYPLLDHLVALDGLRMRRFPLGRFGRWSLEPGLIPVSENSRIVSIVHPNNPTGSYVEAAEADALGDLCARDELALISDEVFAPWPQDRPGNAKRSLAEIDSGVVVALGGLSKELAAPGLKLSWIRLGGGRDERRRLRGALEVAADAFLSVGSPVQAALPSLLSFSGAVQAAVRPRLEANLARIQSAMSALTACQVLPVQGGWNAVIQFPASVSDEDLALGLLEVDGVLVQPGFFYDFPSPGFVVVSLLAPEVDLAAGLPRLIDRLELLE